MNFIIFSRNFYPQNDAEAFCTTRFASALASAGHSVHVVTAEYACDYDYKALLDPRVKVTRVRTKPGAGRFLNLSVRQQMVMDKDMCNVPRFCCAVKKVLKQYDKPILITRALPLTSLIVGVKTRRYAYKWISHFSDPIPWFPTNRKILKLKERLSRRWVARAISSADAISVTCPLAIRYYREAYSKESEGKHFLVATHIGDNKLDGPKQPDWSPVFSKRTVLHPGDMYFNRGEAIFQAIDRLNEEGVPLLFVLDRPPSPNMTHWFRTTSNAIALGIRGGGLLNAGLNAHADVVFIPDFVRDFDYSPYLMSKFVYQIYGDRPIVVHAKTESCMAEYCRRYPEAGLFFSEAGSVESLVGALKAALECDVGAIRREEIRREFSADSVAKTFVREVEKLMD